MNKETQMEWESKEAMPFREYLISMLGKKKANEILKMTKWEKEHRIIVVSGRQGPTGKSVLVRVLRNQGYKAMELSDHVLVELNEELPVQIHKFEKYVGGGSYAGVPKAGHAAD